MSSPSVILNTFSLPLFRMALADAANYHIALSELILRKKAEDAGIQRSNRLGWHSRNRAHLWHNPAMQWLCAAVKQHTQQVLSDYYPGTGPIKVEIAQAWANVNATGGWNVPHLHLGCPWVACYYVSVDALKAQHDQEGWVSFVNPLPAAALYWQAQQIQVLPRDGELLIFPGAVLHYVHPNLTETPRISIAFNLEVHPEAMPWQQENVYGVD